jgi:hypothetical protein
MMPESTIRDHLKDAYKKADAVVGSGMMTVAAMSGCFDRDGLEVGLHFPSLSCLLVLAYVLEFMLWYNYFRVVLFAVLHVLGRL